MTCWEFHWVRLVVRNKMQGGSKRRLLPVAVFVVAWLAVGLAVPLLVGLTGDQRVANDTTVVAAPRHEARIYQTLTLDQSLGLWLNRGRLVLATDPGTELNLRQRDDMIASGEGRFAISDAKLTFFSEAASRRGAQHDEFHAPMIDGLRNRRYRSLSVEQSKIVLDLPSGEPFVLRASSATIQPARNGGTRVRGRGIWYGHEVAFSVTTDGEPRAVEVEAGKPQQSQEARTAHRQTKQPVAPLKKRAAKRQGLSVKLQSDLFELTFEGSLTIVGGERIFEGDLDLSTGEGPSFLSRVVPGLPATRVPDTVKLAADARWTGVGAQLNNVALSLDNHSAVGTLGIQHRAPRPQLIGTLDFDSLDVTTFNAQQPALALDLTDLQSIVVTANRAWERLQSGLRTPIWRNIDVDLRISAEQLQYSGARLGRTAAAISLHDGLLKTHVVEFGFAGGTGTGQVSVDFTKTQAPVSFRGRINDADGARAMAALVGIPALDGPTHIKFDLELAQPEPGKTLRDAVSGDLTLETPMDKSSVGVDLAELIKIDSEQPLSVLQGITRLKSANASFSLVNGRAYCRSGTLKVGDRAFKLSGWFGLDGPQGDFVISEIPQKSDKPLAMTAEKQDKAETVSVKSDSDDTPKPPQLIAEPRSWRITGSGTEFSVSIDRRLVQRTRSRSR